MPINPSIALGVQPIQLADPLAQYAKFAAIQQAQNENALAQYKLGAAQREEKAQNALSAAYQAAYDPEKGTYDMNKLRGALITAGVGAKLPDVEKKISELRSQQLTRDKTEAELIDIKLKQSAKFLEGLDPSDPTAPQKFIAWHEANHKDPVLGPALAARGVTAEQSRARIEDALARGPQAFARLLDESKLGIVKFAELNKVSPLSPGQVHRNPDGTVTYVSAVNPATGLPEFSNVQTIAPGQAAAPGQPPVATPAPGQAAALGQPTIVPDEKTALALAIALDRAGMPVNVRVPGPGSRNALPGAEGVNALAGDVTARPSALAATPAAGVPPPGETPRQTLERFQSNLRRGEALEKEGFRLKADGSGTEFIPGGIADPKVIAAKAEAQKIGNNSAMALEKLPNAIVTTKQLLQHLHDIVGDATVDAKGNISYIKQPPAKGFNSAFGPTGIIARAYPGSEAAGLQARLDQVMGGAFMEAYETLRGAAGISEKEGVKATASRMRASFSTSPAEFITAIREYIKSVDDSVKAGEKKLADLRKGSAASASSEDNKPSLSDIFGTPGQR